jgi:plastocyanin
MKPTFAVLALLALGCGGGKTESAQTPAATQVAAPPAAPVHEVHMELVNKKYRFRPASLSIKAGDVVRFINASGGPHNVAFKKDKIPAGAEAVLNAAMKGRISNLGGPFIKDSLATYEVSFAGAPAGSYTYTCQPHEPLGMTATLTVTP